MLQNIFLDYDFAHILATEHEKHTGSCIKHQIYEIADIHEQYGGFPKTYCFENTIIHQLWWDSTQLDFQDIGHQLGMEVITISSIKQPPGCVIPLHRDTFFQINKQYPDRNELKVRANIHLEDWKLGHFLQYNDVVHTHWKAGQGLLWDSSILHLGANAGMHDKYTLQVSGFFLK